MSQDQFKNSFVTLCRSNDLRVDIYKHNKQQFPLLNKAHALEFGKDWEYVKRMFNYFKIPISRRILGRGQGKVCRWAAVIMFVKYAYDVDPEENIMCIEDDIKFDQGFSTSYDTWKDKKEFVKLSVWGEMFACKKLSAQIFLEKLYSIGINENSDQWIMKNMDPYRLEDWKGLLGRKNKGFCELCCKPNRGFMRESIEVSKSDKHELDRAPHEDRVLLDHKLFEPNESFSILSKLKTI